MPYRSAPLSFSKIDCFRTCAWRFVCKYIQKFPDPSGVPAEVGGGFHSWSESASRGADELAMVQLLEAKAALLVSEAAQDLRAVVHRYLTTGGMPPIPSDATDVRNEAELAIRADGTPCGFWDEDALFRGKLDLTWLENDGRLAVVRDWKTARKVEDVGDQLEDYGILLAAAHPAVQEVVAELHFVRFAPGGIRKATFDAEELRAVGPARFIAIAEQIDARVEARDVKPRISDECRWCAYRQHCPAMKGGFKPFAELASEADAVAAAESALVLELQLQDLTTALRAWTLRHGPLRLPDGQDLGHHPTHDREVADTKAACQFLQQLGVSADDLWSALTLPVGKVEKALKTLPEVAGARRGKKTEALHEVLAQLFDAGILTETDGTKFGKRKPGVEVAPETTNGGTDR